MKYRYSQCVFVGRVGTLLCIGHLLETTVHLSREGFTYQYLQMNALLQDLEGTKYDGKIKIVGFPCNQFKHQEPARNTTELLNGLRYVRPGEGFIPAFDLMNKSDVNGPKENPVYTYLKSTCRIPSAAKFRPRVSFWEPIRPSDIVWNFEKFVIDAEGRPLFRFLSPVEPLDVKEIMMQVSDNGKMTGKQLMENNVIADRLLNMEKKYKHRY